MQDRFRFLVEDGKIERTTNILPTWQVLLRRLERRSTIQKRILMRANNLTTKIQPLLSIISKRGKKREKNKTKDTENKYAESVNLKQLTRHYPKEEFCP